MLRNSAALLALCAASVLLLVRVVWAQAEQMHPPAYQGVRTLVDGVFVTPIPGAPFLAVVNLQRTQVLADGTSETLHSIANIARDSQGRIYNERRELLPYTLFFLNGLRWILIGKSWMKQGSWLG